MTQMENSVNLLERGMELQNSEKSSKKVIGGGTVFVLLLILAFSILIYFLSHSKAPDNCWAQATLDTKTTATETNAWTWANLPTSCFKETGNQKLIIVKKNTYLVYGQIKIKSKNHIPFAIRLVKGVDILSQRQSKEDIINLLGIYHFNEGDEISLVLNDNFKNIEKNSTQTYWGILRMPSHHS